MRCQPRCDVTYIRTVVVVGRRRDRVLLCRYAPKITLHVVLVSYRHAHHVPLTPLVSLVLEWISLFHSKKEYPLPINCK